MLFQSWPHILTPCLHLVHVSVDLLLQLYGKLNLTRLHACLLCYYTTAVLPSWVCAAPNLRVWFLIMSHFGLIYFDYLGLELEQTIFPHRQIVSPCHGGSRNVVMGDQVWNSVGKITYFGLKYGICRVSQSMLQAHTTQMFVPPSSLRGFHALINSKGRYMLAVKQIYSLYDFSIIYFAVWTQSIWKQERKDRIICSCEWNKGCSQGRCEAQLDHTPCNSLLINFCVVLYVICRSVGTKKFVHLVYILIIYLWSLHFILNFNNSLKLLWHF